MFSLHYIFGNCYISCYSLCSQEKHSQNVCMQADPRCSIILSETPHTAADRWRMTLYLLYIGIQSFCLLEVLAIYYVVCMTPELTFHFFLLQQIPKARVPKRKRKGEEAPGVGRQDSECQRTRLQQTHYQWQRRGASDP